MLLIILTGFTYYTFQVNITNDYVSILQEMQQLDLKKYKENIEIVTVSFTSMDLLNITVENKGPFQTHLIWLGIFNEAENIQKYYKIDFYIDPVENLSDIRNDTIPTFEGQERTIQLVTDLGNTFSYSYPKVSMDGVEKRYDWVDSICDSHPPSEKGTHAFFSAQQYGPDGIVDILTEENMAESSANNQTVSGDLDRDDWITNQNSAGNINTGFLSDTYSSDNIRYELIETKATGGGSQSDRNYLLAWRFDFTSLTDTRLDTKVYIEAHTTGETFRIYWSSDDVTMNYIGTVNSTSDNYLNWDIPDDTSTTIYILIKDNNDERADATDTDVVDIIRIDTLFLTITSSGVDNYELDLEVQWNEVDFNEANEWLCIYGGTMDSEDILVDVWNGADWITVLNDLQSGWNSVDISTYLVSSTFTIRFRGGMETTDTEQDRWELDVTFLHVWT